MAEHIKNDVKEYRNGIQDDRLNKIEKWLKKIVTNDLHHIDLDLASLKTDMGWLKKLIILVITSIGSLIVALIVAIITRAL